MIEWHNTPRDVAHLFNPAFFGEICRRVSESYVKEAAKPMPFPLALLAMPLVVYPDSRQTLKPRSYDYLHTWITANPEIRLKLPRRCLELAPYVRLGIAFAMTQRSLEITETGGIRPLRRARMKQIPRIDTSDYFHGSRTLGRWFARVELDSNIFVMLGVRL